MQERQLEQAIQMQRPRAAYIKSVAGTLGAARRPDRVAKGLLDSGAITQAEFEQLKAKALAA